MFFAWILLVDPGTQLPNLFHNVKVGIGVPIVLLPDLTKLSITCIFGIVITGAIDVNDTLHRNLAYRISI